MKVIPYKTPIVHVGDDLFHILEANLPQLHEGDVVVVTSLIVGLCEKAVVKVPDDATHEDKYELVKKEAEYYIDHSHSKYHLMLTIKRQILAMNAGIDQSNADGYYVLWPKDPQRTVNAIWHWLRKTYHLERVGVILSDSKTYPLRWGVIGTAIAQCGFTALNDMRGKPDLFGRLMIMTQINVADALAAAAVFEMGETNEQTPLAVISDLSSVAFQDRPPTLQELKDQAISLDDDAFAPILQSAKWLKGQAASI